MIFFNYCQSFKKKSHFLSQIPIRNIEREKKKTEQKRYFWSCTRPRGTLNQDFWTQYLLRIQESETQQTWGEEKGKKAVNKQKVKVFRDTYVCHVRTPSSTSLDSGGFFSIFTPKISVAMGDSSFCFGLVITSERTRESTATTTASNITLRFDRIADISWLL